MSRLSSITPKQQRVLCYVQDHIWARAVAPLQREIAEALGISRHSVQEHLKALHVKRAIILHGWPRGITVLENGRKQQ